MWRAFLPALAIYIVLRPIFGLAHELTVAGVAELLHAAVATDWWQPVIAFLRLDPVYAGAAVRAIGGLQIAGLAVAGPLGAWLNAIAPAVMLDPARVTPGAGVSAIAAPGAPALGRVATAFVADALWLTVGLWLLRKRNHPKLALIGLLVQAQIVVNHLLDAQVSVPDLNASGIPFALAVALPGNGWFTSALANMAEPARTLLVGGSLVVLGYACAALVLLAASGARRLLSRRAMP